MRTQPHAREGCGWSIVGIWLREEPRHVPLFHAKAEGPGGLELILTVARLRGVRLEVRPRRGPDGVMLPVDARDGLRDPAIAVVLQHVIRSAVPG
ncbi:hypothetical protein [Neoroseomonas rubea]|uniref:hypothetical protein n=1 Tax=Neoroseomonas rubea TaxID=2748666 RepID=UPI0018DF0899|nr:hypothetical protein [Roseomonas rubea]